MPTTIWDDNTAQAIVDLLSKLDHKTIAVWAADCAGHVLSCFDKKYPSDGRPLKAIEAGQAWVRGDIKMSEARTAAFAAHTAARDADDDAARAAARSAGHAAATAHVASHAVHAANYAVTAAACAAIPSESSTTAAKEREWQYQRLLSVTNMI